jgi:hypothetical protein
MAHIPFNFASFASTILESETEEEVEESLGCLRTYIEDVLHFCHELEIEKMNLETEVDDLRSQVLDLENSNDDY